MDTSYEYEVNLKWSRDRMGILDSNELNESIAVATPPEFPGGMEGIWSPEHLFVASVSSCLMTTFLTIAENSKLNYISLKILATGTLKKTDGKFMITDILLKPVLTIPEDTDPEKAERILHKSEAVCLISNSVKSKVTMETEVRVTDSAVIS